MVHVPCQIQARLNVQLYWRGLIVGLSQKSALKLGVLANNFRFSRSQNILHRKKKTTKKLWGVSLCKLKFFEIQWSYNPKSSKFSRSYWSNASTQICLPRPAWIPLVPVLFVAFIPKKYYAVDSNTFYWQRIKKGIVMSYG